jgi:heterodisulfide reductase subunit B
MKVVYYPGCSLETTGRAYDHSARAVCAALDVELAELPAWVCCGSSAAYKTNRVLSLALAAENLNQAAAAQAGPLMTPCPYCFRRLKSAATEIGASAALRGQVEAALGREYAGDPGVHNLLGLLRYEVGLEAIRARVTRPLAGLKVVAYYGCALTRPPAGTGFDHPENPRSLDEVLAALGADVIDWNYRTECCGAGLAVPRAAVVHGLVGRIVEQARLAGAQAIVLACQLCQSNLDLRQAEAKMPILYFTQLMGLAFGLPEAGLGLRHHRVDPRPVLSAAGAFLNCPGGQSGQVAR